VYECVCVCVCLRVCVCVCMHVSACVCMCMCVTTQIEQVTQRHTYVHTRSPAHIINTHMHTNAHMHTCIHVRKCEKENERERREQERERQKKRETKKATSISGPKPWREKWSCSPTPTCCSVTHVQVYIGIYAYIQMLAQRQFPEKIKIDDLKHPYTTMYTDDDLKESKSVCFTAYCSHQPHLHHSWPTPSAQKSAGKASDNLVSEEETHHITWCTLTVPEMIVIRDALFLFLFFTMCNMFFPTCSCRRSKFSDLFSFLLNTCCLLFACEWFRSGLVSCLAVCTCLHIRILSSHLHMHLLVLVVCAKIFLFPPSTGCHATRSYKIVPLYEKNTCRRTFHRKSTHSIFLHSSVGAVFCQNPNVPTWIVLLQQVRLYEFF